jgi:hypothetical protein
MCLTADAHGALRFKVGMSPVRLRGSSLSSKVGESSKKLSGDGSCARRARRGAKPTSVCIRGAPLRGKLAQTGRMMLGAAFGLLTLPDTTRKQACSAPCFPKRQWLSPGCLADICDPELHQLRIHGEPRQNAGHEGDRGPVRKESHRSPAALCDWGLECLLPVHNHAIDDPGGILSKNVSSCPGYKQRATYDKVGGVHQTVRAGTWTCCCRIRVTRPVA